MISLITRGTVLLSICTCQAFAQARDIKLIHGAGLNGSSWATATVTLYQSGAPGVPVTTPTITQQVGDLVAQGVALAGLVRTDSTILVGHSKGGVISREASRTRGPRGIATLSSPHGGVPAANNLNSILSALNLVTFLTADVLLLSALNAWYQPAPTWLVWMVQAGAVGGGIMYQDALSDGILARVQQLEPYRYQLEVGSSFLSQLPVGGIHRSSVSVQQSALAEAGAPWSAFFPSEINAAGVNQSLASIGYRLILDAFELTPYVDLSTPDGYLALMYAGSAGILGGAYIGLPLFSCLAVSSVGGSQCLPSDGFIPVSSQVMPGAVHTSITAPTHQFNQNDATANLFVIARVQTMLGS